MSYKDVPYSKCLSTTRVIKGGSGKMSSAHGLTKNNSPTSGLTNASGRLGAGTRPFRNKQGTTAGKS